MQTLSQMLPDISVVTGISLKGFRAVLILCCPIYLFLTEKELVQGSVLVGKYYCQNKPKPQQNTCSEQCWPETYLCYLCFLRKPNLRYCFVSSLQV